MRCFLAALLFAVFTSPAAAADKVVVGAIQTRVRQGATAAVAVVYAERLDGPARMRPPAVVSIGQKNKAFVPRVIGVPTGSTVTFPNDDPIFHNVFSLSAPQPFDLGLYRSGASKSRTFTAPAVYHVFCNIHPQMVAFLVVAPSSWVTTAGADGSWRLDLPMGRYRITALSERASAVSAEIVVGATGADAPPLTLDESAVVAAPHLNKHGLPYPKAAYSDR